mmetsp:Transcript_50810/g.158752  ORF Transcript_50810/g.158752 Transcript_50810/m.158752 type:complete len:450 (-) Transcript_50810:478-1827(-)
MGTGDSASHLPETKIELLDHEEHEDDDFLMHIKSPQVKPCRNSSLDGQKFSLSPTAANGHHKQGAGHEEHRTLSRKFMSMSNLHLDDEEEEAAPVAKEETAAKHQEHDAKHHTLDHTVGTVTPTSSLKRTQSELAIAVESDDEEEEDHEEHSTSKIGEELLVVFDMDRTMVGDLVALSDRDNIETNVDWTWWPEGRHHGLNADEIVPFLKRGMLRPGLISMIQYLREIGATIVVYTHSERAWASKVCAAMEEVAGFKFIYRLFSRQDCKDGHPEFAARKSLQFVCDELSKDSGMSWVSISRTIMFDDDGNVLGGGDQCRLIRVPTYDYWEPCQWDEVVNDDVLSKNSAECVDIVTRSVVEWGIAPPSFGKEDLTEGEIAADKRWEEAKQRKEAIKLSYNKVAKLDRLWFTLKESIASLSELDDDTMEELPARLRKSLGQSAKPMMRRRA